MLDENSKGRFRSDWLCFTKAEILKFKQIPPLYDTGVNVECSSTMKISYNLLASDWTGTQKHWAGIRKGPMPRCQPFGKGIQRVEEREKELQDMGPDVKFLGAGLRLEVRYIGELEIPWIKSYSLNLQGSGYPRMPTLHLRKKTCAFGLGKG